ncbi:MAG: ABC transporter permease [Clostridia bacterium]|nr:ABC transporter permease [Clostridia bacterium]
MKYISKIYIALVFLILYIPILVLMLFSFNKTSNTGAFDGFSLYWYRELFKSPETFTALKNTLILAVSASLISTVIGTTAAVGMVKMKSRFFRSLVNSITNVPMMNPEIVTGISMMLLFVAIGTIVNAADKLSFWTLLISHVTFCLPYVILSVMPRVKAMDKSIPEAAMDLGCTPLQSFFKVELPMIMPGIVTGMIMAFTLSLDDFVISYFTNGNDFQTLPLMIYSMTKKEVKPDIYALSTLMIIAITVLLILSNFSGSKGEMEKKRHERMLAKAAKKQNHQAFAESKGK